MEINGDQVQNGSGSALWGEAGKLERVLSSSLATVFFRMFTALLVTAVAAYAVATVDSLQRFVFGSKFVFYGLLIGELGLVMVISFCINKLSVVSANVLFFIYAIVNGLTLSVIFFVYSIGEIYAAFGITALMFAVMAGYGALTHRDLSSIGSICFMGLIGIILASLVNFLLKSTVLDYIICYVGILVFVGLTAFHTQKIKTMLAEATQEEAVKKIVVIGALNLYLDFINLFLKILSLLGRRR